jgi:hypothetical protein
LVGSGASGTKIFRSWFNALSATLHSLTLFIFFKTSCYALLTASRILVFLERAVRVSMSMKFVSNLIFWRRVSNFMIRVSLGWTNDAVVLILLFLLPTLLLSHFLLLSSIAGWSRSHHALHTHAFLFW